MKYISKYVVFFSIVILKAYCSPTNPSIISGTMSTENINPNEIHFNVSDKAIINWENFSINSNEIVNFVQPSVNSIVLNRVTSAAISEIYGNLKANGNLFLINPNGVIIGKDAIIETASFLASTLNLADVDFLSDNLRFVSPGSGSIINYGTIITKNGDVTIFGKTIENHGDILADGSFNIGIGEEIFLQVDANDKILIKTKINEADGFTNTKIIQALKHEIKAEGNPYSYAINLDGEISKLDTEQEEGRFYLSAIGGKVKISKYIKQDDIDIIAQEIDMDQNALIETKTEGAIDIRSIDRMEINGVLRSEGGTIVITNDNIEKACFISGEIDVSSNEAGLININIPRLCNTASLKANSVNAIGGTIQINSNRIIEVEKALLSATSEKKDGGTIDVFASDHFFTSAQYIVNGNTKGGTIQISTNADTLNLVSSKLRAEGAQEGSILLNSNNDITINSKTQMLGSLQHNLELAALQDISFTTVDLVDPNAGGGSGFGDSIVPLSTGNVVVTKPQADFNGANSGACYLYNGDSLALISQIIGNASDRVGLNGVVTLTNGNFVISSQSFNSSRGAATWGSGTLGVSGTVSSANSLVGSSVSDQVGNTVIKALTNGNYVVASALWNNGGASNAGAVTWGSGTSGVSGTIDNTNSLVGTASNDNVGSGGVVALTNGNYVVISPNWNDGGTADVGAVTWGNGTTGIAGDVSSSNSLVGSTNSDKVGNEGIVVLTNGNYVVSSRSWDNPSGPVANVGAATWGNGTTGITGAVSTSNSLVGSTANDRVSSEGVTALTNGNYVVISINWNAVGAATWGDGTTGITGSVSVANSLIGSALNDSIGSQGVFALTNGNYVVASPAWDNGAANAAGAATWGNGTTGITGVVSSANSLVGSFTGDQVSLNSTTLIGIIPLTNGNYVVSSPAAKVGAVASAGAATWGDGTSGVTGAVSTSNSLFGSTGSDRVARGVIALTNGNYVVQSPFWNGVIAEGGAATWGDGSSGTTGAVSISNSIYGTTSGDQVGLVLIALTNGNFVTDTLQWNNGAFAGAGSATWGDGTSGTVAAVGATNSLVGTAFFDAVTFEIGSVALSNGNYVVVSDQFFPAPFTSKGAVSFGDGTSGTFGAADSTNSIIGSTNSDKVGSGDITLLAEGNYLISSPLYDDGANVNAGAVTLGDGTNGTLGTITSTNSVISGIANSGLGTIAVETVFQKAYINFANEGTEGSTGSGRVVVMQFPITPTPPTPPTPAAEFSFDQKVQISNTTFVARSELFRSLHPFNEYIKQYLEFPIKDELHPMIIKQKSKRFYLREGKLYDTRTLQKYFIRERNDKGTSSMQEPKTL